MSALLIALGGVVVGAIITAATDLISEEFRGRLDRLPQSLVRLAGRRLPGELREDMTREWLAELHEYLHGDDAVPVTRLYKGIRFSLSLHRAARTTQRSEAPMMLRIAKDFRFDSLAFMLSSVLVVVELIALQAGLPAPFMPWSGYLLLSAMALLVSLVLTLFATYVMWKAVVHRRRLLAQIAETESLLVRIQALTVNPHCETSARELGDCMVTASCIQHNSQQMLVELQGHETPRLPWPWRRLL
ncbi:hypothetical protein [Nocardiopsis synnemataformans]|uniref:hypothetical protein n=1 Tax=Nocardiopsis synnemataformans TaxID=61305 RepID=UPI003EBD4146